MKLTGVILLLVCPLLFTVACRHKTWYVINTAPVVNVTEADNGKTLVIEKRQALILTLPDKVDGGYRFDKPDYDSTAIKLQNHHELPPKYNNTAAGRHGTGAWQFEALKSGQTKLIITASRPWNPTDKVTLFKDIVMVK